MSLFDDASLVLIPDGAKDGKLYSVKPTDGTGDFTFTRGSNLAATRVDENGLIEKGRENLLLQSNQFDTTWLPSNASVTSGQSGYDGSSDAWKLIQNTNTGFHYIYQFVNTTSVCTYSIYAKAAEYQGISFFFPNLSGSNAISTFNLSSGAFISNNHNGTFEDVGDGWYRISLLSKPSGAISFNTYVNQTTQQSEAGDGTSGIYIQDAQVEQGLVATDYIETGATTAQAGILEDLPRIDYSGGASCPALLLEPQRTNLFEHSEYFEASDWTTDNITLITNDSESVEGVDNATLMYPTATKTGTTYIYNRTTNSSARYTISSFVKADGKDVCWLYLIGIASHGIVYFDLSDESIQAVAGSSSTPTGTITDIGNDWYRITCTLGIDFAPNFDGFGIGISDAKGSLNVTANGTDGILVYGLQLEQGSYPTSYIPTYGSSVTRSADSCTKTSATALIGQTEGTLFAEVDFDAISEESRFLQISDGTNNNRFYIGSLMTNNMNYTAITSGTTIANISSGAQSTGVHKVAAAYANNDFVLYIDGVQIATDTNGSVPAMNQISVGYNNLANNRHTAYGTKQAILFKTRLSNTELAALTTL